MASDSVLCVSEHSCGVLQRLNRKRKRGVRGVREVRGGGARLMVPNTFIANKCQQLNSNGLHADLIYLPGHFLIHGRIICPFLRVWWPDCLFLFFVRKKGGGGGWGG